MTATPASFIPSDWDIRLNCHESMPKMNFLTCSRAPPLQHAALLITVLISAGFPRAQEWDIVGEMWQRDPPIAPSLALYPPLCLSAFSGEWIHPIHPETMAFCSSFCPSCRPAFLYCWATTVRTKWRGVPPVPPLLSGTCRRNLGSRTHRILLIYLSEGIWLKPFICHIITS